MCRVAEEEPKTEADRVVRWEHDLFVREEQGPRSEEEKKKVRTRGEVAKHSMFVPVGEASSPGTLAQMCVPYPKPECLRRDSLGSYYRSVCS